MGNRKFVSSGIASVCAWLIAVQPALAQPFFDEIKSSFKEAQFDDPSFDEGEPEGPYPFVYGWPISEDEVPLDDFGRGVVFSPIGEPIAGLDPIKAFEGPDCTEEILACHHPYPTAEVLFPERVRGEWLGDGVADGQDCESAEDCGEGRCVAGLCVPDAHLYSYETCTGADLDTTRALLRTRYRELDGLADLLPSTGLYLPDCGENCSLRVNTAFLGRTLHITDRGVACDDPDVADLGWCSLGDAGTLDDTHRGDVVVAERIVIDGEVDIGGMSLLLVARSSIEFRAGSMLRGVSHDAAAFHVPTPRPEPMDRVGALGGDEAIALDLPASLPEARDGAGARASAAVVLVAPRIDGEGRIDLRGARGSVGQDAASIDCDWTQRAGAAGVGAALRNAWCRNVAEPLLAEAPPAGDGGMGGDGGRLVVRSRSQLPATIQVELEGGPGGAAGHAGTFAYRDGLKHHAETFGSDGQPGQPGARGQIDDARLAEDDLLDFTFMLGRRGAERSLVNGRHFARLPAFPGSVDAVKAAQNLGTVRVSYCGDPEGPLAFVKAPKLPGLWGGTPPRAPTPLVSATTRAQRAAACTEAKVRRDRLADGLNYAGLPPDLFVYQPPHAVVGVRNALLELFDTQRQTFLDLAEIGQAAQVSATLLDDRAAMDEATVRAAAEALTIAVERHEQVSKVVFTTLSQAKRNHEGILDLQTRVNALGEQAEDLLAAQGVQRVLRDRPHHLVRERDHQLRQRVRRRDPGAGQLRG